MKTTLFSFSICFYLILVHSPCPLLSSAADAPEVTTKPPSDVGRRMIDAMKPEFEIADHQWTDAPDGWIGKTQTEMLKFTHRHLKTADGKPVQITYWITPADYEGYRSVSDISIHTPRLLYSGYKRGTVRKGKHIIPTLEDAHLLFERYTAEPASHREKYRVRGFLPKKVFRKLGFYLYESIDVMFITPTLRRKATSVTTLTKEQKKLALPGSSLELDELAEPPYISGVLTAGGMELVWLDEDKQHAVVKQSFSAGGGEFMSNPFQYLVSPGERPILAGEKVYIVGYLSRLEAARKILPATPENREIIEKLKAKQLKRYAWGPKKESLQMGICSGSFWGRPVLLMTVRNVGKKEVRYSDFWLGFAYAPGKRGLTMYIREKGESKWNRVEMVRPWTARKHAVKPENVRTASPGDILQNSRWSCFPPPSGEVTARVFLEGSYKWPKSDVKEFEIKCTQIMGQDGSKGTWTGTLTSGILTIPNPRELP